MLFIGYSLLYVYYLLILELFLALTRKRPLRPPAVMLDSSLTDALIAKCETTFVINGAILMLRERLPRAVEVARPDEAQFLAITRSRFANSCAASRLP
ncbi:hypothetical protein EVAR_61989_1 [Eumeta japonica]|uniref:Uncharacterized protein n=1 Tax=Eumeta variegata TaxID=151549 RepID=A0A4C1YI66_EUMVA|nr:hypothetical protein EVAR_61989_1 [Eumeta japonica]